MANGAYYVDQALTNVSQAWLNNSEDFISEKLFPVIPTEKRSGKYWAYSKDGLRVPSSTLRSGKAQTQEASFGKTLSDFGPLQEHALKDFITKDEYDMTDAPLSVESDVVTFLNQQMLIAQEQDLANILGSTAIITQNTTKSGTGQWNDYLNSTPFQDIKTGAIQMRSTALKVPNTVAMSWEVWIQIVDHPDFLDRIKWSQTGVMTEQDFLKLMAPYGIQKLFIGKVQKNTGVEGQTDALSSVWGKDCLLGYVTDAPGLREVNGGYTLRLNKGKYVDKKDEFDPKGSWVRNNDYYDQMLFAPEVFYLIKNAVAQKEGNQQWVVQHN